MSDLEEKKYTYQALARIEDGDVDVLEDGPSLVRSSSLLSSKKLRRVSFSVDTPFDDTLSRSASASSRSRSRTISETAHSSLEDPTKDATSRVSYLYYLGSFAITVALYIVAVKMTTSYDGHMLSGPFPDQFLDVTKPYSIVDPRDLGVSTVTRSSSIQPGQVFKNIASETPLPTNAWCQNLLLGMSNDLMNQVFVVPNVVDLGGSIPGLRLSDITMQAEVTAVRMNFVPSDGLTIGSAEITAYEPVVIPSKDSTMCRLSLGLQWQDVKSSAVMSTTIARGSPYTSMQYTEATPVITADHFVTSIIVDSTNSKTGVSVNCSSGAFRVNREMQLYFSDSDIKWLVFISTPAQFICKQSLVENMPRFLLKTVATVQSLIIRLAVGNNCTSAKSPRTACLDRYRPTGLPPSGRPDSQYIQLLRNHSKVYASIDSNIYFDFPSGLSESNDMSQDAQLNMIFDWMPQTVGLELLDDRADHREFSDQLLMFALPHHQQRLQRTFGSINKVLDFGCVPTLLGDACPVIGAKWSMLEHLHRVNFSAAAPVRSEMRSDVAKAVSADLKFKLPSNYRRAAGDNYFAGKMLARIARTLLIAEDLGMMYCDDDIIALDRDAPQSNCYCPSFVQALQELRSGVEVWFNGSAEAPQLYDSDWGGYINCGCYYYTLEDGVTGHCANRFPECPALFDVGQDFGNGFYNDHHFQYGYHIYAAAVLMKYDGVWARKFVEHVLLYVRDIANSSPQDPYFPTWRHKDWYMGFSWARGIVTNLNGRNEESSSEAIHAYEAVALLGHVIVAVFNDDTIDDQNMRLVGARMRNMGRLLCATELRSAKTYWHVQVGSNNQLQRIYPAIYEPRVVGMMWSMLAQAQTWFGSALYLSYGIQLLPLTPIVEERDTAPWVAEMLPFLNASCVSTAACEEGGWSVLVYAELAVIGRWKDAWDAVNRLPSSVFSSAGGNGHSLGNTLWFIATRPEPNFTKYD